MEREGVSNEVALSLEGDSTWIPECLAASLPIFRVLQMNVHNSRQEKKAEAFIVKMGAYKNNMLLMFKLIDNLVIVLFSFGTAN